MKLKTSFLALLLALTSQLLHSGPLQAADKVRIEIEGLGGAGIAGIGVGDLRRNVLATLSLEEARGDKDLAEDRIRRLHSRAPEEIAAALQPFGYYRPQIQSRLERDGDTWVALYTVEPGPALKVTRRDVQILGPGADDPGFQGLLTGFPLAESETLYHPDYESGKVAFEEYAAANGYLDAKFQENQIRIDLASYTSDVIVLYETGPRYLFGPARFHQDFLDPDLLRGYVTWKEGDPIDVNRLLRLQDALADSPYFQRVEVVTRQEEAEGLRVPIDVNLIGSARQKWSVGAGYGTETGPRGTVALDLRRINREGHRGQSEARISEIEKSFSASYQIPGSYPRTDVLTFQVGYADLRPETSRSESLLAGVGLTRARGSWREAFGLNFQREDFEVGLDKGVSELLIPQASWSRVKADNRISATSGQRLQLDIRGADESLLSKASLIQAKAEGKLIHSFADRFRFISSAQVGWTETDQFRELPPTLRFFAGGDQSVRGYAYQQLGPLDEAGNVIGGESLLTASVEIEYRLLDKWRFLDKWGVAAFYDAGNAMTSFSGDLEQGAGVGLRWVSPIGPIRADAAWALTEPGRPVRFHLTIGPDL